MMDWYSNYPAPSKEEAIMEVGRETGEEKYAREIIAEIECLGSYTGWYVLTKPEVIKKVNLKKEERKQKEEEIKKEKKDVEYVLRHITGDDAFTYT